MKPKIIFIHGMFLTPKSWESWISYFTELGYDCEAPAWPLHEGEPAVLRGNPPVGLGDITLEELHGYYRALIPTGKPVILIGHSLGGLLVQKLVAEGLAVAGVGICSVAPNKMLSLDWGFLRNTATITNPMAGSAPFEMTEEGFHRNFANTLTEAESRAAWQSYAVHESRQVLRDILGDEGKIDFEAPHVPLLFVGAQKDAIIPNTLVLRNAEAYKDQRSHSEYVEFSNRGHFICGEPGWEEVAERVANWLTAHLASTRS